MSMNYVGSISIIDRGDAPAKAVIDKNTRSLAQRVADETKDELNKVMDRVDNIYVSYEMSTQTMFENPRGGSPSVEYVEDIKELEEIIKDTVKKKKYQQQVTVFIVGFQDVCAQKMQLMQQVNQFFLENSQPEEEVEEKVELDLEEASQKVNESLSTAEDLAKRLGDLNQDIIEWLVNYANTKASNKNPNAMVNYDKGKKRLEKSLEAAKNDMNSLSEKLLNLQTELEEKEEKLQQLNKQLEAKTQEAVRFKTAAEVAKKSAQDNETHTSTLQDEISRRDEKIIELRQKLSRMEINLTESQFETDLTKRKVDNASSKTKLFEIPQEGDQLTTEDSNDIPVDDVEEVETVMEVEKLAKLQEEVDTKKMAATEAEREMEKLHKEQMHELKKLHFEEVDDLKKEHKEELSQLTVELETVHKRLSESQLEVQQAFDESDDLRSKLLEIQLQEPAKRKPPVNQPQQQQQHQQQQQNEPVLSPRGSSGKSIAELSTGDEDRPESRPSTKDTKSSKKSDTKPVKSLAKSPSRGPQKPRGGKDFADASVQDEGGDASKAHVEKSDPSRQATRQSKTLEPVAEGEIDFANAYDLDDEESWSTVPANQVNGRFVQYRHLTQSKVKELEEQLNITLTKTHRKVNSLKSQFNEHKGKWEAERKILIEQVEQAQKLQTDAEKEADAAMTQLEEFINEQEKLEDEEETKRQEVLKTMSRPGTTARKQPPVIVEQKPARASPEAPEKPPAEEPAEREKTHSETPEQELKKLMQQTDDAKSRPCSTAEDDPGLAPWLTPDYIQGKKKEKPIEAPSEAKTDPQTDIPYSSRLTSAADAELQMLLPAEERPETQVSNAEKKQLQKPKSETRLPVDLLKGERERLRSRQSSKASRPPMIIGSQLDEKDEDVFESDANETEEESEEEVDLAPWMKSPVKKRAKPPESRQSSRREVQSEDLEGGDFGTLFASPPEKKTRSSARKSKHSSFTSNVDAEKDQADSGEDEEEEITDQKSGVSRSRSDLKSHQRQSSELSQADKRSSLKEDGDDDDSEPEDPEPKKKVKRKHKKETDKESQKIKENNSFDKEKSVTETIKKDKETKKAKKEKSVVDKKVKESADAPELRTDHSRMSITRQGGKRRSIEKGDRIEDIDGEDGDAGEAFSEIGKVTKMSELSINLGAGQESGSEEEKPLATDEEKIKLMVERTRSRSAKSHTSGKGDALPSRQSGGGNSKGLIADENQVKLGETSNISDKTQREGDINNEQITIEGTDDMKVDKEKTKLSHSGEKTKQEDEAGNELEGRDSITTPYTRQMSQHPRGEIEADTPYTRQMSHRPGGEIIPETPYSTRQVSHRTSEIEPETPYTRQMSHRPGGEVIPETPHSTRQVSHRTSEIEPETPYTRQMSHRPGGEIIPETPYSTRQVSQQPAGDIEPETPYTRQMSHRPGGEVIPETPCTVNVSQHQSGEIEPEAPYTRQMSHRLDGDIELKSSCTIPMSEHLIQEEIKAIEATNQNQEKGDTYDENAGAPSRRSHEATSVAKKRLTASVEVIMKPPNQSPDEALEKNSRHSGAISAPPAVEPGDEAPPKPLIGETPREDFESQPVTPKTRPPTANQSVINLVQKKPDTPKQAFRTPRASRSGSSTSVLSEESIVIGHDLKTDIDKGAAKEIAPSQSDALHSLKNMMVEENLTVEQQKTLDSLRTALKSIASTDQKLTNKQLERTVTILSLASQLAHESAELGVVPDSVFNSFSSISSPAMSDLSDEEFESDASKEKGVIDKKQKSTEHEKQAAFNLVPEKTAKRQKSKSPKKVVSQTQLQKKPLDDSDRVLSGSMNLEYSSSRDSFSASLPRTLTSSEWKRMSPHDPFSPENVKPKTDDMKRKHAKEDAEQRRDKKSRHEISVVISPRKKSRAAVTRETMLYGDGSLHVEPTGRQTAMDIMQMETASFHGSRLDELFQHSPNTPEPSDTVSDNLSTRSLTKSDQSEDLSARSLTKSDQSDQEPIPTSPRTTKTSKKTPKFPKLPQSNVKPSKFKCVSKLLTVELASLAQSRQPSARAARFGSFSDQSTESTEGSGSFSIVGTKLNKLTSPQKPDENLSKSLNNERKVKGDQTAGSGVGMSRSKSDLFAKRPKRGSINRDEGNVLLGNKNQYSTNSTEFSLNETLKENNMNGKKLTVLDRSQTEIQFSDSNVIKPLTNMVTMATQCTENIKLVSIAIQCSENDILPLIKDTNNKSPIRTPGHVSVATQCVGSDVSTEIGQEVMSEPTVGDSTIGDALTPKPLTPATAPKSPMSQSSAPKSPKSPKSSRSKSFVSITEDPKPPSPDPSTLATNHKRKSISSQADSIDIPSTPAQGQKTVSHDPLPPPSPLTAPTPGTNVSEIPRPVSYASFQTAYAPIQTGRIPSPVVVVNKETQTDTMMPMIEKEPIKGNTEEEIRASSAKSRASLRSQFKNRLDETRQAVEERRTKSPVISVPSQKSIDDELIIEEDDDDLPIPDDQKAGEGFKKEDTFDHGTSPPPGKTLETQISVSSRHSVNLSEHPVVKEYLRAYTGIHNFKEAISRILEDKDQMSASQILADLDNLPFNKETKVVPQIESMTENIYYVLNEVSQVVNSVLQNDRGPVVSSLMMGMSRDPTQRTIVREKSAAMADFNNTMQPGTRASQRSQGSKGRPDSASTERQQYKELQEQYEKLQNQMSDDTKKFEEQQKHNVVVMMEMQDTINQLQRELSALGKQPRRPPSDHMSTPGASQNTESAVMFTRLDSERNAKIMKKAVNEKKLDTSRYKEAMVQMDDYVNLPGQRLAHLVRKYVHHCRMKEIEENVQHSSSLNENVFEILDKMEALQNQRAKRWADKMDEMGMERMKLANVLMETFDDIERESGIFLIKPMYSYRGREAKDRYAGKISRPFRPQRTLSPLRDVNSAYAPAPTPASNMRPVRVQQAKDAAQLSQPQDQGQATQHDSSKPLEGDSMGLAGSSVRYVGTQPKTTWNMADSQSREPSYGSGLQGNTPRILELDINRMMIGQNTISASIPGLSNDRLVNASNSNLRSYMTVNRPTGPASTGKSDRPTSGSRGMDSPGPPPSPTNRSSSTTKRVRMSADIEVPTVMSSTQPLPPIGGTPSPTPRTNSGGRGRQSPTRIPIGEVSPSPPGSRGSFRQSPVGMSDTDMSPIK